MGCECKDGSHSHVFSIPIPAIVGADTMKCEHCGLTAKFYHWHGSGPDVYKSEDLSWAGPSKTRIARERYEEDYDPNG
jgi:hypothetical protein